MSTVLGAHRVFGCLRVFGSHCLFDVQSCLFLIAILKLQIILHKSEDLTILPGRDESASGVA